LSQEWVGMALYTDGFAGDLPGVRALLPYLQELGVNLVHLMPILRCPGGASDGGYAVSDFRDVDPRVGTLDDVAELARSLRARRMLLTLDVVLNHTSDEHEWAQRAREGDETCRGYYYTFPDRKQPDLYEEAMPEVFPETAPGNFTWDDAMERWVMTVFNRYQWDLNYRNPAVFIEMLDIILFWANHGADVLRLDAVAFLWKRIGTACQNEREAHLVLQLLKDCCQVVAPGVLFIAEAIVAPVEVTKYFGEDAVVAKECEIAYNATLMALLWDAVATRNPKLLGHGIRNLPGKLDRATWLNYVRCHDDIGLGFDDRDIVLAGYDPASHRRFLVDYFTGAYGPSEARGVRFGENRRTGDARIAGTLASLVGLEAAIDRDDDVAIDEAIQRVEMLHAVILSFGGIPMLYYGDELGTLNDYRYRDDDAKAMDTRWVHRPRIDPSARERRREPGSVEARVFGALQRLIAVRKTVPSFSDFNNREVIDFESDHLFAFLRTHPVHHTDSVLVVANFDHEPHPFALDALANRGRYWRGELVDLVSASRVAVEGGSVVVPGCTCYWLVDQPGGRLA
ncbi:MAG: hypothetical protein KDA28_09050, partial [Phycisphaerales bacterium]|nr:hypothetical protein [Phycisphaerales bacterium]